MQNVLVIFQATRESTEGLALALGLGAVQQGANIRLRHLESTATAALAHQACGRLGTADLTWAEGLAIILEADEPTDLDKLVQALASVISTPDWAQKAVYVFGGDPNSAAVQAVRAVMPDNTRFVPDDPAERSASAAYLTSVGQRIASL